MFAMGLVGGIFGIICAVIALIIGGIDAALSSTGTSQIWTLALLALAFSILGIVSAAISKPKPKLSGWLMLASGIAGFICISVFYLLPGVLLVIGGFMGIFSKKKKNEVVLSSESTIL